MTKFLNISTDNTLGGSAASDVIVASQKAVKDYVDSKTGSGSYHPDLFDHKWSDYELSDMNWLRADTFSWHNGGTDEPYDNAYQHLVDDVSAGVTTTFYAWHSNYGYGTIYTLTQTPVAESDFYYRYQNGEMVRQSLVDAVAADYSFIEDASVNSYDRNSAEDVQVEVSIPRTETIAGITITYYLAADGHKIVLADQESNVVSIYNATGVAWYYILDEANQRFKLPRSKHEHYGDRPVVGNGYGLGLKDSSNTKFLMQGMGGSVSNNTYALSESSTNGTVGTTGSRSSLENNKIIGVSTDPTKSGVISTPVEDTDQYKYLYFYVGNFTQTALENTAGLNAELFNGKADIDAQNFNSTGKAYIAKLGMPSDTKDVLTVGTSGATYQAPANGYFYAGAAPSGSGASIALATANDAQGGLSTAQVAGTGYSLRVYLPVRKGVSVALYHTNTSSRYLYFVYAEGEI